MSTMQFSVICLLSVGLALIPVIEGWRACLLPSRFWCSSAEVAKQCQVTSVCKRTEWRTKLHAAPLVNLTLYYESLCPDCRLFTRTQLYPTYQKIGEIINLDLVPYGNAEETKEGNKWVFNCQHGEDECVENLMDTCALKIVNNINKSFPFIACMESSSGTPKAAFDQCSKKYPSIPANQILECTKSEQGNKWEHEMAVRTNALQPPHQYVPWVTLNGVHTQKIEDEAEKNLLKLICDTYTGTKPPGCQGKPMKRRCPRKWKA